MDAHWCDSDNSNFYSCAERADAVKDKVVLILVAITLGFAVFTAMTDNNNAEQVFFDEVREFMSKGGRNTAEDGMRRDKKISELIKRMDDLEQ